MTNRHYIHEKRGNAFVIYNCFVILLIIIFSWPLFGAGLTPLAIEVPGVTPSSAGDLIIESSELSSATPNELTAKRTSNTPTSTDFEITESFVYPNPVRLQDDWALQYTLSEADDLETRIYDMFGRQVYKKRCLRANTGCEQGENEIDMGENGKNLSSGVYFFVLIHDNKIKAEGKFAAVP